MNIDYIVEFSHTVFQYYQQHLNSSVDQIEPEEGTNPEQLLTQNQTLLIQTAGCVPQVCSYWRKDSKNTHTHTSNGCGTASSSTIQKYSCTFVF